MLAWSAFEGILRALGKTKHQVGDIAKRYNYDSMLDDLHKADPAGRFFDFVHARLDVKYQKSEVQKFLTGDPCCGITLARAVRHIFVHGPLTPSANQADPEAVSNVCDRLAGCLFRVMDREFSECVDKLITLAPPAVHPPEEDYPF
jgi:hypothetical protein